MRNHRNRKICPVCKGGGRISKVKMTSNGTICEFEVCYHCKGSIDVLFRQIRTFCAALIKFFPLE